MLETETKVLGQRSTRGIEAKENEHNTRGVAPRIDLELVVAYLLFCFCLYVVFFFFVRVFFFLFFLHFLPVDTYLPTQLLHDPNSNPILNPTSFTRKTQTIHPNNYAQTMVPHPSNNMASRNRPLHQPFYSSLLSTPFPDAHFAFFGISKPSITTGEEPGAREFGNHSVCVCGRVCDDYDNWGGGGAL